MKKWIALGMSICMLCGCAGQSGAATAQNTAPAAQNTAAAAQNTAPAAQAAEDSIDVPVERIQELPQAGWQAQIAFPDWKEYTDDTLAMNSMFSFWDYHGQGSLFVSVTGDVESFRLYINDHPVDTQQMAAGGSYKIDISSCAKDGRNTLQVSNICPAGLEKAVTVSIP